MKGEKSGDGEGKRAARKRATALEGRVDSLRQGLFHAARIAELVRVWDAMRGPGQALEPEAVNGVLDRVPVPVAGEALPALAGLVEIERRLVLVLKDPVYLNDDRDREIIAARIALCQALKQVRETGVQNAQIEALWEKAACTAW